MVIATTMQERINTGGICHIAIDVSNLEQSTKSTDMFTMDIVSRSNRIVHLKTSGADNSFFLFKADGPVNPRGCGMTHSHFGFRIDDRNFDKAVDYIKGNDIKIHPTPDRGAGKFDTSKIRTVT